MLSLIPIDSDGCREHTKNSFRSFNSILLPPQGQSWAQGPPQGPQAGKITPLTQSMVVTQDLEDAEGTLSFSSCYQTVELESMENDLDVQVLADPIAGKRRKLDSEVSLLPLEFMMNR